MTNVDRLEQTLLDGREKAMMAIRYYEEALQMIGCPVAPALTTRQERRREHVQLIPEREHVDIKPLKY